MLDKERDQLLERARYWIIEDIAAGADEEEEHLLLIEELCQALEGYKLAQSNRAEEE